MLAFTTNMAVPDNEHVPLKVVADEIVVVPEDKTKSAARAGVNANVSISHSKRSSEATDQRMRQRRCPSTPCCKDK